MAQTVRHFSEYIADFMQRKKIGFYAYFNLNIGSYHGKQDEIHCNRSEIILRFGRVF
jgi:hypothetical protein